MIKKRIKRFESFLLEAEDGMQQLKQAVVDAADMPSMGNEVLGVAKDGGRWDEYVLMALGKEGAILLSSNPTAIYMAQGGKSQALLISGSEKISQEGKLLHFDTVEVGSIPGGYVLSVVAKDGSVVRSYPNIISADATEEEAGGRMSFTNVAEGKFVADKEGIMIIPVNAKGVNEDGPGTPADVITAAIEGKKGDDKIKVSGSVYKVAESRLASIPGRRFKVQLFEDFVRTTG